MKVNSDQIFNCIVSYIKEHKYAPTMREIGAIVGLQSHTSVYSHLNRLHLEGRIRYEENGQRTIVIPGYAFVKIPAGMTEKQAEEALEKIAKEKVS